MIDPKLAAIFQEEAREHLDILERLLLSLEAGAGDPAASVDECFRRAHTLKGAARAVGLAGLQDMAHELEDLIHPFRGGAQRMAAETIRVALARVGTIRRALDGAEPDTPAPAPSAAPPEANGQPPPPSRGEAPRDPSAGALRIDAQRLDRMLGLLGNVRVSHRGGAWSNDELSLLVERLRAASGDLARHETDLRRSAGAPSTLAAAVQEIRLAVRATAESLEVLRSSVASRRAEERLVLDQLDGELRRARLVPLSTLALFLERACRDAAAERQRQVELRIEGGDVPLDRLVIDAVREPLLHLVRNAVAHGIEPPDERARRGKPARGQVTIEAHRRGNRVRIRLRDDGGGVDLGRLRQLAAQWSDVDPEQAPEEALLDLLFRPGVTTASAADAIAGRGAGLEIVRTRLREVQGDVGFLQTGPQGTVVELHLPVHLQSIRILRVRTASGVYGVPTASVLRTTRVGSQEIRSVNGRPAVTIDGTPIPLASLDAVLGAGADRLDPAGLCLVLEAAGRRVGVHVADVDEETEVLIRELGHPLKDLPKVSGGALQPDGSVLLVLDPTAIGEAVSGVQQVVTDHGTAAATRRKVLIVDDSPTTRAVLRGLFAAAGFDVVTAADGAEGQQAFVQQGADVVVSDIQMPRLDGFGLTRAIKAMPGGGAPVVLVTGRESEEDRRAGLGAGADAYLVKSAFAEGDLIETVRRCL